MCRPAASHPHPEQGRDWTSPSSLGLPLSHLGPSAWQPLCGSSALCLGVEIGFHLPTVPTMCSVLTPPSSAVSMETHGSPKALLHE